MDLLFNLQEEGIDEVRKHVPGLYASNNWADIKSFIETSAYELIELIGLDTYQAAYKKYDGSLDESEFSEEKIKAYAQLAALIQALCSKSAYLQFAPLMDLKNDGNGRRMHVDEHSRAPWQWMLNAADEALYNQWQMGINRLFMLLDGGQIAEWKETTQYQTRQVLFCKNAVDIDPLTHSYWFYARTLYFNQDAQEDSLPAIIGLADYAALSAKLKEETDLSENEKAIIQRAKKLIRHLVMIRAFQEMPLEFLPQGLVQRFRSDRENVQASQAATEGLLDRALSYHQTQARQEDKRLRELVRLQQLQGAEDVEIERHNQEDKFFRP